jgi:hypothetical protein
MKNLSTTLRVPAIIGFILVFPFLSLELINRRNFHEDFPFPLFGILWLLSMTFSLILMPLARNVQAGNRIRVNSIGLLLRVACLVLIAWMWVGIILDQMPCFLGVRYCD